MQVRIKCIRSEKHFKHLYIHSSQFQFSVKNSLKSAKSRAAQFLSEVLGHSGYFFVEEEMSLSSPCELNSIRQ